MVSVVFSAGLAGIDGYVVSVECALSPGLPRLDIVGLPDKAVSEAVERVRAAMHSCGFEWPASRITVNLAPADLRKQGAAYDLPILLAILVASGQLPPLPRDALFLGELSLSGKLRPVAGALNMALAARAAGFSRLYLPTGSAAEAALAEGLEICPVPDAAALLSVLTGALPPPPPPAPAVPDPDDPSLDFAHVLGQEHVRRACEVAAAGGHNLLLSGPPGAGKSMMARRFASILPPLTQAERLEVIRIWSACGLGMTAARLPGRPVRAPHHTASAQSIAGGSAPAGGLPMPGEVSLAHHGVLFLDELPEFHRDVLETLRQPLEDGVLTISRVAGKVSYPARFQLVAAMNPCKCGWYGTPRCTCRPAEVARYLRRISGPLLDRIDLQVTVQPVTYAALAGRADHPGEPSAAIRARVLAARAIQQKRFAGTTIDCNAAIPPDRIAALCPLTPQAEALLASSFERLGLTARAYDRVLRVARTIADLAGADILDAPHIAEAIGYRSLEQQGLSR